ncbi:MAG: protease inhibitor Kazal-type [Flavobacteriaceae bacterium]|nr:protease inhibitor Kazal-type [Flavobacteriaceae bacterium]OUX39897.1 MAG: hypothetical protein CBE25_02580 [Flavobacteriaceae bacterium TMED265]
MKKTLALLLFSLFACGKDKNGCLGSPHFDLPCPAIFDSVCSCNGVTYGNACTATAFGILSYEQGSCADNL